MKLISCPSDTKKQIQAKTSKPETKFDKAATSAAQFGKPPFLIVHSTVEAKTMPPNSSIVRNSQMQCMSISNSSFYCVGLPGAGSLNKNKLYTVKLTSEAYNTWPVLGLSYMLHDQSDSLAKSFFSDISWSEVPPERLTTMHLVHSLPRGRLLGGSGKSSKLAALAAARRKKEEEKQSPIGAKENERPTRAISLLDRLASNGGNNTKSGATEIRDRRTLSFRPPPKAEPVLENVTKQEVVESDPKPQGPPPELKADPSIFAVTVIGPSIFESDSAFAEARAKEPSQALKVHDFPTDKVFSNPSPDDVVLAAQARGIKR